MLGAGPASKEKHHCSSSGSRVWRIVGFHPSLTYTRLFVREDENNQAHHLEMKPDLDLLRDQNSVK